MTTQVYDATEAARFLHDALTVAAMDAHPDFERDPEHPGTWIYFGEDNVDDDDLIDWFQRTHPREARAIGARIV